jgi:hypothetical protein
MKIIQFTVCFLLAMFLCGFGCSSSKPTTDPLTGFHRASKNPDQIIEKDYQDYIQKIPPKEKDFVGSVEFFEDGTGQHAIDISVGVSGRYWRHILIYDKDDKRIKTIKYKTGAYQS